MHACVSVWTLPPMTSLLLCLLALSSPAASTRLGLEDVFFGPRDQTVGEGEGVFFQCVSGESFPPAGISWLKDGEAVTRGRQIQGEYGGGDQKKTTGTLHLLNVTLEDDGMYTCVTRNPSLNISNRSRPAKLTVHGVPRRLQLIQGPDNITVATGTAISMHCAVRGFPVPMVHWFKNGCHLTNCSTSSLSLRDNGQLLTFRNVTKEDEGSYHCEASNHEETIKSQPAFLLPAEMDWSFVQQPVNLTVKRGENVTVTCRPPRSRPSAQVSWFKNNRLLLNPAAHVTVLRSGDLFFHSIQESDGGSYFCRASNVHLQRFLTSRRATLAVLAPPSVKLWPRLLTVPVGARVELECQVTGHPVPTISWIKRGHSKQTGGRVALGQRNATLLIQSARSFDEGVYVCEASNSLGQSRSTAMLSVAVSPVIVTFVGQLSCRTGTSVVLPCRAVGLPPITYTWTRAETQPPIGPTEDMRVDEDGALHISSVQWPDGGEYYCTAENRAGRHQRRTVLTVTDKDRPADRGQHTRLVLSAVINTTEVLPLFIDSLAEQHLKTTRRPLVRPQPEKTTCSSSSCEAATNAATTFSTSSRLKLSQGFLGHLSQLHPIQPTADPAQLLVTQSHRPLPHPNLQPVDDHSQLRVTSAAPLISDSEPPVNPNQMLVVSGRQQKPDVLVTTLQYLLTESQSHSASSSTKAYHQPVVSNQLLAVTGSQGSRIRPGSVASQTTEPELDSSLPTPTHSLVTQTLTSESVSVSQSQLSQTQSHPLVTKSTLDQSYPEQTSTLVSQTKLENPSPLLQLEPSPTPAQIPPTYPRQSSTLSFLPKFHSELSTAQTYVLATEPPTSSITTPHIVQVHSQPSTAKPSPDTSTVPQTQPQPYPHPQPSISTTRPHDQTPDPSTMDPEISGVPRSNKSDQVHLNVTQQGDSAQSGESANDTELTEWLKKNTSQSPMTSNDPRVTQRAPSWLPVVEKHDIPIVVGVGVSLAFIFITVTFYSVVQKNETVPPSRAAQRVGGVPIRHAERRAAGGTYENRAFEDDDCVAVIEQSPNTSDTRARPPGPSLVTVQMEPTSEDRQEDTPIARDNHSVTIETYPESIVDTKIDPSLEGDNGRSLSQPSIQLQCAEDWTSNPGDNHSLCQDALPPPSSLPSRSPSPSPPSRREEGLHSSLTLQSPEQCAAPIHHSLSISHGNPPLLLSHHVSLGLTTVAVDVHFYPAATAPLAVGTSTRINSVSTSTSVTAPLLSPPLVHSHEADQSAARPHQCK